MGRSRRYGQAVPGQPRHQRARPTALQAQRHRREPSSGGTRPPPTAVRARPHKAGRVGQLIVMVSSVVFIASATLLIRDTKNGTGWKSLLEATHGDPASPLRFMSFNILIGLVALVFLVTIISIGVYRRLLMIVVVVAALVLMGTRHTCPQSGEMASAITDQAIGFLSRRPSPWHSEADSLLPDQTGLEFPASPGRGRHRAKVSGTHRAVELLEVIRLGRRWATSLRPHCLEEMRA